MPLTTAILLPGFAGCEHEPAPSRVPELIRMLGSEEPKVRADAAYQLGQLGPEARSAVPDLIVLLGDATLYESVAPASATFIPVPNVALFVALAETVRWIGTVI